MERENELQLLSFVLSTTFGVSEAKEMAQHLRALAALSQDLGLIPSTSVVGSQPPRTSVPGDPLPSSDLYGQNMSHHCQVECVPSREPSCFTGKIMKSFSY